MLIAMFLVALAALVCLGWALWYLALWICGASDWDAVSSAVFMYQFVALFCACVVLGFWNHHAASRGKTALISILGVLFVLELNMLCAVPLVQRLEERLPLLLHGAETQGRVLRVYEQETERRDFLFHSRHSSPLLEKPHFLQFFCCGMRAELCNITMYEIQ